MKAEEPPKPLITNPTADLASKYEDLLFSNDNVQPATTFKKPEVKFDKFESSREVLREVDANSDDLGDVGMLAKMLEDTRNTLKTMDIGQNDDEEDENEEEKYANSFFHIPKSIVAPAVPSSASIIAPNVPRNDDDIQPWKCPIQPQPQVKRFNDAADSFALVDYTRKPKFSSII